MILKAFVSGAEEIWGTGMVVSDYTSLPELFIAP